MRSELESIVKNYHRMDRDEVRNALRVLKHRKANMSEVARKIGITRQRVHQLANDHTGN